MSTYLKKMMKKLFKDRIKSLVIVQTMLAIPLLSLLIYVFATNNKGNDLYDGVGFIIIALIILLRSLEYIILKNKEYAFWYLIFAMVSFYFGIDYLYLHR